MRILYINDIPVGCLTSVSQSETIGFIQTCKTSAKGAITSLPTIHAYSIPFEAVMVLDGAVFTWEELQAKGHNRERLDWSIIDQDTNEGDAGQAFIENLTINGSSEDFIKFTGTLTGYGAIVNDALVYYVWAQAPGVYVDEQTKYVFVN